MIVNELAKATGVEPHVVAITPASACYGPCVIQRTATSCFVPAISTGSNGSDVHKNWASA